MLQFLKTKFLPFSLVFLLSICFLCPSLAEETSKMKDFSLNINFALFPENIEEGPSDTLLGLASILERLSLAAYGTTFGYMAAFDFSVFDREDAVFSGYVNGNPLAYKMTSDLFEEAVAVLEFPSYIPFLVKAFHYFDFPFQYIGMLTDTYSFEFGLDPALDLLQTFFAGTKDRSYSYEETIKEVTRFSQALMENEPFMVYLKSIFHQTGLDDVIDNFIYDLPTWTQEIAPDGLAINIDANYEIWATGDKVFLQKEFIDNQQLFSLTLPPYEGYTLTVDYHISTGDVENNLWAFFSISKEIEDTKEKEEVVALNINGKYINDSTNAQHIVTSDFSFWGSGVTKPLDFSFTAPVQIRKENGISFHHGSFSFINKENQLPMSTLYFDFNTNLSEDFPSSKIPSDWQEFSLFTMNDISFSAIKSKIVKPAIKKLLPFAFSLPTSVTLPLAKWALTHGVSEMLMPQP